MPNSEVSNNIFILLITVRKIEAPSRIFSCVAEASQLQYQINNDTKNWGVLACKLTKETDVESTIQRAHRQIFLLACWLDGLSSANIDLLSFGGHPSLPISSCAFCFGPFIWWERWASMCFYESSTSEICRRDYTGYNDLNLSKGLSVLLTRKKCRNIGQHLPVETFVGYHIHQASLVGQTPGMRYWCKKKKGKSSNLVSSAEAYKTTMSIIMRCFKWSWVLRVDGSKSMWSETERECKYTLMLNKWSDKVFRRIFVQYAT